MSINHYTSDWWSSPNSAATPLHLNHDASASASAAYCSQSTAFCFSHHNNENEEELLEETNSTSTASRPPAPEFEQQVVDEILPKEPLFEKSLTPSDVGKLNRLVIPKQHAEKYLPLNGCGDTGEKGLLLSFEDEVGKSWRFRYSYWNSSQSYVLTRGWSRFVKEKRLDAGDAVIFLRHREDIGRLFIGWRRRNSGGGGQDLDQISGAIANNARAPPSGGGGWSGVVYNNNAGHSYLISQYQEYCSSLPHHHQPPPHDHCPHAAGSGVVEKQTTAITSGNTIKRVRLFGVNLDQWESSSSEPLSSPDDSAVSSHGQTHHHHHQYPYHH